MNKETKKYLRAAKLRGSFSYIRMFLLLECSLRIVEVFSCLRTLCVVLICFIVSMDVNCEAHFVLDCAGLLAVFLLQGANVSGVKQ